MELTPVNTIGRLFNMKRCQSVISETGKLYSLPVIVCCEKSTSYRCCWISQIRTTIFEDKGYLIQKSAATPEIMLIMSCSLRSRLSVPDNANAIPIRAPISSTVSDNEALFRRNEFSTHETDIFTRASHRSLEVPGRHLTRISVSFMPVEKLSHTCTGDKTKSNSK